MRLVPAAALAATLVLLAGCGGDELTRRIAPDRVTTTTRDANQAATLISEYRRQHGLGPVRADGQLNEAAEFQARAVAEAGQLSHGAFASRMVSFKVPGYTAENLSAGSDSVGGALARWQTSDGHNENLLMPQARRIGLARADSPGQGYGRYWALVLAQ